MKTFLFGLSAAFSALILETAILALGGKNDLDTDFYSRLSFFMAVFVLIEETLKYLFLKKYFLGFEKDRASEKIFSLPEIAFFALGFSSVEIFLNYLSFDYWEFSTILMLSGLLTIHFLTSFFMGKRFQKVKKTSIYYSLSIISFAFLLHFLYNIAIIELVK